MPQPEQPAKPVDSRQHLSYLQAVVMRHMTVDEINAERARIGYPPIVPHADSTPVRDATPLP